LGSAGTIVLLTMSLTSSQASMKIERCFWIKILPTLESKWTFGFLKQPVSLKIMIPHYDSVKQPMLDKTKEKEVKK